MFYDKGFDCGLWKLNRFNIMIVLFEKWNGLYCKLVSCLFFEVYK